MAWLVERKIDVALLQETKCTDDAFPFADFAEIGYQSSHHGVNHWNGVAIVSRVGLEDVARGFQSSTEFDEPRLIAATCGGVRCWSVYVPNGRAVDDPHFGYKLKWLDQLAAELHSLSSSGTSALVAGDFNVGMADIDFYDAKRWAGKKHATAEERAGVQSAIDLGFVDLARDRYPNDPQFTWWNYVGTQFAKNKGLRIDLALGSKAVANRLEDVWVDRHTRDPMVVHPAKPSDHAPLIVDLL
ncbi:MAG: exodeoxyribonuclease-3 [Acidimicrobiales bacterium]|jgi:exodeoxyribonuclease-3